MTTATDPLSVDDGDDMDDDSDSLLTSSNRSSGDDDSEDTRDTPIVDNDSNKGDKIVFIVIFIVAAVASALFVTWRAKTSCVRPSPGFTGFGLRRQYSQNGGFHRRLRLRGWTPQSFRGQVGGTPQ